MDDGSKRSPLQRLRSTIEGKYGVERPTLDKAEAGNVVRFSRDLPDEFSSERRQALLERIEELRPWLQGPFFLGGDVVIGGPWKKEGRWRKLRAEIPDDLSSLRVLDVGTNAGFDCFMFKNLHADYVMGVEPSVFFEQAQFLESVYESGVDFHHIGWQQLDPERHGRFDLVHCNGLLYHEIHPMLLLQRLREMLTPDGTLILGSMTLAEKELEEYMRFVPGSYREDPTWWWVPGRAAVTGMLEAAGFAIESEFAVSDGPPGHFPVLNRSFRARATAPIRPSRAPMPSLGR